MPYPLARWLFDRKSLTSNEDQSRGAHLHRHLSALLKQYIREKGSDRVRTSIASPTTETIFVAEIALAEVAAVIATKHRAWRRIGRGCGGDFWQRFLVDCKERYVLVKTDRPIIDRAVTLSANGIACVGMTLTIGNRAFSTSCCRQGHTTRWN